MEQDFNPLTSQRDAADFVRTLSHINNQQKQNALLEEQVRLQREANELKKRELARSGNVSENKSSGSNTSASSYSTTRHYSYTPPKTSTVVALFCLLGGLFLGISCWICLEAWSIELIFGYIFAVMLIGMGFMGITDPTW